MGDIIKARKGLYSNIDTLLLAEFGFATDEERLYIGGNNGNVPLPNAADLLEKANQSALDTTNGNVTANTTELANTIIAYSAGTSKGISNTNATVIVSASTSNVEIARITSNQITMSCLVQISVRMSGSGTIYTALYLVISRGGATPSIIKISEVTSAYTGITISFGTVVRNSTDWDLLVLATNTNATNYNFATNFIASKSAV